MSKSSNNNYYTINWEIDPYNKRLFIKYKFNSVSKKSFYIDKITIVKSKKNKLSKGLKKVPNSGVIARVNDSLSEIILKKDITKVREFFDTDFYAGKRTYISSGHLKLAIDKGFDDVLHLLLRRGARFTDGDLKVLNKEEYKKYRIAAHISGCSLLSNNNRLGFR